MPFKKQPNINICLENASLHAFLQKIFHNVAFCCKVITLTFSHLADDLITWVYVIISVNEKIISFMPIAGHKLHNYIFNLSQFIFKDVKIFISKKCE